nr:DUF3566 domain-containing protein [Gordonia humi]
MAKAAGVDTGSRPAAGPAPRGGAPAGASRPTVSSSTASTGGGGQAGPQSGPLAPVQGPIAPGSTASPTQPPSGPKNVPAGAPKPPQGAAQGQGKPGQQPQAKPAVNAPVPGPQSKPSPAADGSGVETSKFVESDTRNIPRNELAKKDELPDLDAIHHVEASKEAASAARAQSQTIPSRSVGVPLRAAVQVRRVDPWSVFKVTGVLSIVGFFIWMIAIAVLYAVLAGMGLWDQINNSFASVVEGDSGGALISTGMVFGFSAGFGVVAAVLLTGLATISAYIYNVCADMVGGVEVTLADLD